MPHPRMARGSYRSTVRSVLATALALLTVGLLAVPASAALPVRDFGPLIEGLSGYQPQTTCDPVSKPGVAAFRSMVLAAYPNTGDSGITRSCDIGGTSEHKEGRAWDWTASVNNPGQVAAVNEVLNWLFATDQYGNKYAMARRLGVMYVIWNKKIWGAYSADSGWRCYYGCPGDSSSYNRDPHTSHVHISFDWDGAIQHTTYWGYGLAKPFQQWPGSDSGVLGAITTGPAQLGGTEKVYSEDNGAVIAAARYTRD